ncbi:MAG TPA: TlpA disulfide reductase family protein [Planctomycetaceae bacterium]|nr:TlpA disulfide reductase family protein [Planctomycetaceae bacterium]
MRRMAMMAVAVVGCAAALLKVTGPLGADEQSTKKPEVTIQIANWEETLKLVEGHKGKVVVLYAWSTSCQPCMKEFPNLVSLHKKHAGKGLVCMSLSCDYAGIKSKPPEFYKERVLKFLTRQEATFQNILANVPSDELFDKMQLSSIPAVYVFGRDGKLVKRFDNEKAQTEEDNFTYEDVTKLVEGLLAGKK